MAKKIIIVGGGITGLTTAYYLLEKLAHVEGDFDIQVLEASNRVGGKIHTVHRDGFVLERGADSFLERKTAAVELVEQLGISDHLVRNSTGQAYVLLGDTLHQIPAGSFMGIPVQEDALVGTGLISEEGKKRVQEELDVPKGEAVEDQSLGEFLRRRFGDELIENLVEPLLSGIYSSDIDEMSIMASFPQFYKLEQEYGSVVKGLRATLPSNRASTGKKKGQFLSFEDGLQTLVDALVRGIGEDRIRTQSRVTEITQGENGYTLKVNGEKIEADAVIMTIPHAKVLGVFASTNVFQPFTQMPMSSVANVVCAFDASAISESLEGTGFVVSRNSNHRMTACTWTHRKWPTTTPVGKALLRAYVGKPSDQEVMELTDEEIKGIVLRELKETMGIQEQPLFTMVSRWKEMMPQYRVGHVEAVREVRDQLTAVLPGVFITGSSYEGVGIPDCIAQGKQTVEEVVKFLKKNVKNT